MCSIILLHYFGTSSTCVWTICLSKTTLKRSTRYLSGYFSNYRDLQKHDNAIKTLQCKLKLFGSLQRYVVITCKYCLKLRQSSFSVLKDKSQVSRCHQTQSLARKRLLKPINGHILYKASRTSIYPKKSRQEPFVSMRVISKYYVGSLSVCTNLRPMDDGKILAHLCHPILFTR